MAALNYEGKHVTFITLKHLLQGAEKEALLKKLRQRLGGSKGAKEPAPGTNPKVLWQGTNKNPSMGGNAVKAPTGASPAKAPVVAAKPAPAAIKPATYSLKIAPAAAKH